MKYVLFIIGIHFQIWSFSQSTTKMIARGALTLYRLYSASSFILNSQTSSLNFTQNFSNISISHRPKLVLPNRDMPALLNPKANNPNEDAPNFRALNLEADRLSLYQDDVRNIIQKTQSENSYLSRYLSETNSLADYNQLVNEIYPMQTEEVTSRTNENEFHFFEMKETMGNQFLMNRYKSEVSKKNSVSGLFNLYNIGSGGVEPIAEPQFGYSKMVLTTNL
jgi:hypothetical protein